MQFSNAHFLKILTPFRARVKLKFGREILAFSLTSPQKTYVIRSHKNCFAKTVLTRSHNMSFCGEKNQNFCLSGADPFIFSLFYLCFFL